jgi:hypothetical protein
MFTVKPLGTVVAVAARGDPVYICDRLPNVTVAAALFTVSVTVAVTVE